MEPAAYLESFEEAYRSTFQSRVIARPPGAIVLERTWFYPEGGGQPSDRGELTTPIGARFPVTEVRRVGESIVHRLGRPVPPGSAPPHIGETVEGRIDWTRRYAHMRLHTAQHLVSGLIFRRAGVRTLRASMAGESATIDLDRPWPPEMPWSLLQESVQEAIEPARAVAIRFVPRRDWESRPADRAGLVPLAPQIDPVRVIDIEGIDSCPCGGTHLRSSGEIGGLTVEPPVERPGSPGPRVRLRIARPSSTPRG